MVLRLSKSDWLEHGLATLAREGVGALKVGPMSASLKVSRGSFYWHFRDVADFRMELLRSWRDTATDQVIREIGERPEADRLRYLIKRAFRTKRTLDRAIRSWATEDAEVAAVVAAVDASRVAHIAELLVLSGVPRALHRASFLYWAYLGQPVVMADRHLIIPASALDDIADMFQGGGPTQEDPSGSQGG